MSENEMFKQGLEVRRAVLGSDYVDGSIAMTTQRLDLNDLVHTKHEKENA